MIRRGSPASFSTTGASSGVRSLVHTRRAERLDAAARTADLLGERVALRRDGLLVARDRDEDRRARARQLACEPGASVEQRDALGLER